MLNTGVKDDSNDLQQFFLVKRSVDLIEIDDSDVSLISEKFSTSAQQYLCLHFNGSLQICFRKKKLLPSLKHWINSKVGNAKCISNKLDFEAYLKRARANGYCLEEVDLPGDKKPPKLAGHFQNPDSGTSLEVYHDGNLFQGVVTNAAENVQDPIFYCASKLYRQLLWLRTRVGKAVSQVFGFSVRYGHDKLGNFVTMSKMRIEIPSKERQIGAKFPLFVHSKRYLLSPSSTASSNSFFNDLGAFLLAPHRPRPSECECLDFCSLYPGPAMLVSKDLSMILGTEPRAMLDQNSARQFTFLPTITGSLVVRCQNHRAAHRLLFPETLHTKYSSCDITTMMENLERLDSTEPTMAWYVKCKTPIAFGRFWETAAIAINGTRRRLVFLLERNGCILSKAQVAIAKDWLYMHPFDAILEPHRSLTITRDMGTNFRGQLNWVEFLRAFLSLVNRTLIFQKLANLVHGDVHGGNVLLKEKKLMLIDWDEASRDKPFHRAVSTDEEKRQYPSALRSFPELYTKQQFLELFDVLLQQYYANGEKAWKKQLVKVNNPDSNKLKDTVSAQFQSLCDFISFEVKSEEMT